MSRRSEGRRPARAPVGPSRRSVKRRRRQRSVVTLMAALLVLGLAIPLLLTSFGTGRTSVATSTTTAAVAARTLPLVECPTRSGTSVQPKPVNLPTTITVRATVAQAGALAVYADDQDITRVVAPRGWACSAFYGADGSGGVAVHPPGESIPTTWGAGWSLAPGSTEEAITTNETASCSSCTLGQACPLFSAAAQAFQTQLAKACPSPRPASESVVQLTSTLVAFTDPADVHGDGVPSGGQYPASGVTSYAPSQPVGSWSETCTLPASEAAVCNAALNAFASAYGSR